MSEQGSLRRLSVLMATVFGDMLGFFIVLPLLPFYATRLGADAFLVGLMVSTFAVAQLAAAPIWGRLSDRFGRRPMILGGLLVTALAHLVFAFACSAEAGELFSARGLVALLFASRFVQGAGSATTGVVQAYVGDAVEPAERAKALGWITAATSAGVMIGPAVGSLAASFSPALPGLVAAALCLVNAASGRVLLRETTRRPTAVDERPRRRGSVRQAMVAVLAHPTRPVPSCILIYALGMMAFIGMNAVLALYLQARFGVTEKTIGWFYTLVGAVSLVMRSLILGPAVARYGERRVLLLGLISLAAGFVLMSLAPHVLVFAAVAMLVPIGTALLFPTTTSLVTRYADHRELGATMGVQQAFGGLARLVGPLWSSAAFQHIAPTAPFWISAGLVVALRLWAGGLREEGATATGPPPAPDV